MNRNTHFFQLVAGFFRQEFTSCDLSRAPGSLPHFPDGCCSWATWMIGHYLKYERGFSPLEWIGHRTDETGSGAHSWVVVEGFYIDITSDQFADSDRPVIVAEQSKWHRTWSDIETEEIREIGFRDGIAAPHQFEPSRVYEIVSRNVIQKLSQ